MWDYVKNWINYASNCPLSLNFALSNLQEDVRAEAERTAETIWQTGEETKRVEGWWQVNQTGCKYGCPTTSTHNWTYFGGMLPHTSV